MRPHASRFRAISIVVAAVIGLQGLVAVPAHAVQAAASESSLRTESAETLTSRIVPQTMAGFDPGNIIDDAVFFAKDTMSIGAIQAFLNARVSSCQAGYTCLKDYGMATVSRPADLMCRSPYTGQGWESAAAIIYNVAQACGINPQVLLVTLQKEQSLITHTSPTDLRYRKAMGQGCPDTAACDSRYYGFFNQVYGAAWQFKRYANPPGTNQTFTWYAPGRTWNILFHPNRDCGTSPVYVANQATANLYYYTPYQPNAAARAANYGTGDGCSSYGNRNFYNYFTDWFGSTRAANVTLVRTETDPTIYLLSASSRFRVTDYEDFRELERAFGPTYIVGDVFISSYALAGNAGAILRNASTGVISLFQGGQSHKFSTCELVAQWAGACESPANVSPAVFNRVPAGSEVSAFFRVPGTPQWGRVENRTLVTPLYDDHAARALNGGTLPTGLYMNSSTYAAKQKGNLRFAPTTLVRTADSPQVYLTDGYDRLQRVNSWSDATAFGRLSADVRWVTGAQLSGYGVAGDVRPLVRCNGSTFMLGMGVLHPVQDPARSGLQVMDVRAETCAMYASGSTPVTGELFVKSTTSSAVYHIQSGRRVYVPTWANLLTRNGGPAPTVVTLASSVLDAIPAQAPAVDGLVVKGAGSSTLYLASGTTLYPIPSYALASEIGLGMTFTEIPAAEIGRLTIGTNLGQWLSCSGQVSFGAAGKRWPISVDGAAGFAAAPLSEAACSRLAPMGSSVLPKLFVKSAQAADVYLAERGIYRLVPDWSALLRANGGQVPSIVVMGAGTLSLLPKGQPVS